MNKTTRYSPKFRDRVSRLVFEHHAEHDAQWTALNSIAGKVGRTAETLEFALLSVKEQTCKETG